MHVYIHTYIYMHTHKNLFTYVEMHKYPCIFVCHSCILIKKYLHINLLKNLYIEIHEHIKENASYENFCGKIFHFIKKN
jgi:hypothetical protein